MNTTISEYIDVRKKLQELGLQYPCSIALLPVNFETANSATEFRQLAEAATVKILFRGAGIDFERVGGESKIPSIHNNSFEWIAPTIFVSVAALTENPHCLSVAIGVIANYVTDFMKSFGEEKQVKLEVVIEETKSKSFKRITYEGPPEGLKGLPKVLSEINDE